MRTVARVLIGLLVLTAVGLLAFGCWFPQQA